MSFESRNPIVFLDIGHKGEKIGRIVIELFKDRVPKTAENFRSLCIGNKISKNGKPLCYKGSIFHRILPKVMVLSGDIINFDGSGGESIYGTYYEDENLSMLHDQPGLLSSVNAGRPNTNSSQFVITLGHCPQLNKKNVIFGKVLKGLAVIEDLTHVATNDKNRPLEDISIINCGELTNCNNLGIEDNDDQDIYCPYPEDWETNNLNDKEHCKDQLLEIVTKIKTVGNNYFKKKQLLKAERKYKKALRYCEYLKKLTDTAKDDPHIKQLNVTIIMNLATVKLYQREYHDVLNYCNQVLAVEKKNHKALFKKGQALVFLNEYELGLSFMKNALQEDPDNKFIITEILKVKKKIKTYLCFEKLTFKKMFRYN